MKVVIVNDNHAITTNDGEVCFRGSTFHRFAANFKYSTVVLSTPVVGKRGMGAAVVVDGVKVLPRAAYVEAARFYLFLPFYLYSYTKAFWSQFQRADGVLIVVPACSAPIAYAVARVLRKRVWLYVVGDVKEVTRNTHKLTSFRRTMRQCAASLEWAATRFIARREPVFCLGSQLKAKLESVGVRRVTPAMTSLISRAMITEPDPSLPRRIKIVTVGRLSREKGIEFAIRSIADLVQRYEYSLEYTIVGDGPIRSGLESEIAELEAGSFIRILGRVDHAKLHEKIYRNHNVLLVPSLSEGIPKVILEGMAAGLAIVASNVGGIPDLLGDGKRGWLVSPGSVDSLVGALQECFTDRTDRGMRLVNAHKFVTEHTLEKEVERVESSLMEADK